MFLRSVSAEVAAGLSLTIILIKSSPSLKDSTQWCCTELSVHNLSQIHARHKNELMAMMRQCNAGLSKSADGNEAIRRCQLERGWCALDRDLFGTHCRATDDISAWPRSTAVMERTTLPRRWKQGTQKTQGVSPLRDSWKSIRTPSQRTRP